MRGVHGLLAMGLVWMALGGYGQAQELEPSSRAPNLEPNHPDFKTVPTVTFERVHPNAEPAHYAISVEASGDAAYHSEESAAGANKDANQEPYILKFTVSESTSMRIFELARQANYFKGMPSSADPLLPNSGTRTLTYSEGPIDSFGHRTNGVRNWTTYNDSTNPAVRQLTSIFTGISNSLELGRQLESLHRSRGAGLDAALKRAEERAHAHSFVELQAIAYCLKGVANDPAVSDAARRRAGRLLMLAGVSQAK